MEGLFFSRFKFCTFVVSFIFILSVLCLRLDFVAYAMFHRSLEFLKHVCLGKSSEKTFGKGRWLEPSVCHI